MSRSGLCVTAILLAMILAGATETQPTNAVNISNGWKPLQTGEAVGSMQQTKGADPTLEITVTKTAEPMKGRVGAMNPIHLHVEQGKYYDITFTGKAEKASVGLVFSLETPDGKVLAHTTIPEIGRAAPNTGTRVASESLPYLVALHARSSGDDVIVTVTPIEPTRIELKNLVLTPRGAK